MKTTDLEHIKTLAKAFLHVEIAETSIPFVASHPFTSSWFVGFPGGGILDLREEKNAKIWREKMGSEIDGSDLNSLFLLLNKPYILNFLVFAEKYMSDDDLGKILHVFWQNIETISLDNSFTGQQMVSIFKRASKHTLMDVDELDAYNSLPDTVTIYRGVTSYNKRKKKAFSWTSDKGVAVWFANRYDTGTGEVWSMTVPKERVLCLFDGREKEIIVNLYGYTPQNFSVEAVSKIECAPSSP